MTKDTKDMNETRFHLLIPAAGNATRMGQEIPKPYLKINGKTILRHTIEKFININGLQSIVIIINEDHNDLYNDAVRDLDLMFKNLSRKTGGKTRKESIYNGLKCFSNVDKNDIILIHDAARPLVQPSDITKLLEVMKTAKAATLATPVTDTLYRDNDTIDRDNLWAIQTPQAFKLGTLIDAHEKFKNDDSFTDDAGLMRSCGHKVEIVKSSRNNIKITTAEDFDMVRAMINNETETRTASGYDVHAFETAPSERKLMLGGIEIPHDVALTGHSDADVVLHAVTDALLGAINAGDIGTHFPPSDPQWKDVESTVFLQKAADLLANKGGNITFLDITIMAEEPKITPHRSTIQKRIAEILSISSDRISVKATTTEKLGFIGRKEGIACQALAAITLAVTN